VIVPRPYGVSGLLAVVVAGLSLGAVLHLVDQALLGQRLWGGTTVVVLAPTLFSAATALLRREIRVDVIAVLAMGGALALGEFLAGAIIALMVTGGAALERYAVSRARRELTALLVRAPRTAHRRSGNAAKGGARSA
jgi:cation transport ATPase